MDSSITEKELSEIGFFKTQKRIELSDKLYSYKRNIILVGSLLLFFVVSNVKLEKFSVGLISGSIENTSSVYIFIFLFLIYNYLMFRVYLNKEFNRERASRDLKRKFSEVVALYIYKRNINNILREHDLYFLAVSDKSISFVESNKDNETVVIKQSGNGDAFYSKYLDQLVNDSDIEIKESGSYSSVSDGSKGKDYIWSYRLSGPALDYFNKYNVYQKSLHSYEFFELRLPEIYVWAVILYSGLQGI